MTTEQRTFLSSCAEQYNTDLKGNILPFWMKFGYDRRHGGVYTCVDRDGTLMDTTKSVWFQGRFGYIMAKAAQLPDADPEWIEASRSAIDFIEKYCIDTDGHMFFTVTEDGKPVQKRRYVFSECFAAMAMAGYAAATGNGEYADKAVRMFKNARNYIVDLKYISDNLAPSYFIECLLYNVPDEYFDGNESNCMFNVLKWLFNHRNSLGGMVCQNGITNLFGNSSTQWNTSDAKLFIEKLVYLWDNWGKQ